MIEILFISFFSSDGNDLLVNYSTDYLYLFTVKDGSDSDVTVPMGTEKKNGYDNSRTTDGGRSTTKHHYNDSDSSNCSDEDLPPVKRLRLRGDWSDTGPQSRPEAEEEVTAETNIMQRMSVLFSRWVEDAMSATIRTASSSSSDDDTVEHNVNMNRRTNSVNQRDASVQYNLEDSNQGHSSRENNDQRSDAISRSVNELPNIVENLNTSESAVSNIESNVVSNLLPNRDLSVSQNEVTNISAQSGSNVAFEEPIESLRSSTGDDSSANEPSETLRNTENITLVGDNLGNVEPQILPRITENPINLPPTERSRQTFDAGEVRDAQSALFTAQFRQRIRALNTPANRYTNERQFAASKIQNFIRLHRNQKLEQNSISDVTNKPEHIYTPQHRMVYRGHRNARTMVFLFLHFKHSL